MSDPVIVPLIVASSVISAGAAIQQGRAVAAGEEIRQEQMAEEALQSQIRAQDDELQRRRELASALGEGAAIGAQGGFDPFGMGSSFLAIREETEREAKRDIEMIRLVGAGEQSRLALEKQQSKLAGSSAKKSGFLKAVGAGVEGGIRVESL